MGKLVIYQSCQSTPGTGQGPAGTSRDKAGTNRDTQSLSVPACPCLSLSVPIRPCLSLSIPVCPCLCLPVLVCPFLSLPVLVSPCLSLYVLVSPCLSLFVPVYLYISYTCISTPVDEYHSLHQYDCTVIDFTCKSHCFDACKHNFIFFFLLFYLAFSRTLSFNLNSPSRIILKLVTLV